MGPSSGVGVVPGYALASGDFLTSDRHEKIFAAAFVFRCWPPRLDRSLQAGRIIADPEIG